MLAPKRGLIAIEKTPARPKVSRTVGISGRQQSLTTNQHRIDAGSQTKTAATVKRLLPPRQSRGISYLIRDAIYSIQLEVVGNVWLDHLLAESRGKESLDLSWELTGKN